MKVPDHMVADPHHTHQDLKQNNATDSIICHLLPVHFNPLPVNPVGHAPHSAPVPGAGTSLHSTPLKHSISAQPFLSLLQVSPL